MEITSEHIKKLLHDKYADTMRYCTAAEVGDCTGWQSRRIDYIVVSCYASDGLSVDGFEIKISKADLRRELADPEKHVTFFSSLDTYTLVAPKDIIDLKLLPPKWGALAVVEEKDGYKLKWLRRPLALHDDSRKTLDRAFAINLMRCIGRQSDAVAQLTAQMRSEYERGVQDGIAKTRPGSGWSLIYDRDMQQLNACKKMLKTAGLEYASDQTLIGCAKYFKALQDMGWTESSMLHASDDIVRQAKRFSDAIKAFVSLTQVSTEEKAEEQ